MPSVTRKSSKALEILGGRLAALEGLEAKAGWFRTSHYENGVPVAYIASIHEYGAPSKNIPPRPFMRPTILRMKQKWLELLASGARAVVAGKQTPHTVLDALGLNAQEEIRRSITLVHEPPLKPATIAARKRKRADKKTLGLLDKPLEDTFTMFNLITHVVDKK